MLLFSRYKDRIKTGEVFKTSGLLNASSLAELDGAAWVSEKNRVK